MKKLKLTFDVNGLKLDDEHKNKTSSELSHLVIKNVVFAFIMQSKAPMEEERWKFWKACDAMEKAVADKADVVELEDDWMGLIRKVFREMIGLAPTDLLRKVEENIRVVEDR